MDLTPFTHGPLGRPSYYQGVPLYFSEQALETTSEPARVHPHKRHRLSYHRRIQKKWLKRFGYARRPCLFQTAHGFIAHPSLKSKLEAALMSQAQTNAKLLVI